MESEKNFQNRVTKYLKSLHIWYVKYWGGGTYTKSGIPDILSCVNGIFVAPELKTDTGKTSPLQERNIKLINEAGGLSFVLRPSNFDKFKVIVEEVMTNEIFTQQRRFLRELSKKI